MERLTSTNRRAFIKWMGALPLLGYITTQGFFEKAFGASKRNRYNNIYTRIGVKPVINARGPWTYISGTLELPEVKAAKQQAAEYFVNIWELHRAVGQRLAELSGAEAGLVTSGAAGAMAVATAACIAGTDPAKIWQLPDTTGLKNEVVMLGGRSLFDSAIRGAGGSSCWRTRMKNCRPPLARRPSWFTPQRGPRGGRGGSQEAARRKAGPHTDRLHDSATRRRVARRPAAARSPE